MKNVYKDLIKVLDKAERVFIRRAEDETNDYYYISDAYCILRISPSVYSAFFMTEKPYYRELEKGETFVSHRNERKRTIGNLGACVDLEKVINNIEHPGHGEKLPFLREINDNNIKECNIYFNNDNIVCINRIYIDSVAKFMDIDYPNMKDSTTPITFEDSDNLFLVCPVAQGYETGLKVLKAMQVFKGVETCSQ